MDQIPSAEEFLLEKGFPGHAKYGLAKSWMIEFAKLHRKAILEAASENVEIHSDTGSNYHREFEEGIRNRTIWVPANSILNSYPLKNIE